MSQVFKCPRCETQLGIPHVLVGKEVRCGACSTIFVAGADGAGRLSEMVPPPSSAPQESAAPTEPLVPPPGSEVAPEQELRPRRRRRPHLAPHRAGLILALGVIGFVALPIVFGPVAWVMGGNDLREMREGRMDPEGEGLTRAGYICGIINTCMVLLAFVFVFLFVILMIATKSLK